MVAMAGRLTAIVVLLVVVAAHLPAAGEEFTFVMWKPTQPEVWNRLIALFEDETGIRVKREIGPHSSTAAHALLTQKLKNRDPDLDVFLMDVIWPAEFAAAGWAQALDAFFPASERADFFPAAVSACTFREKIYGIPFWTSGGLLYYRKDLLHKYGFAPPETWEEMADQALKIVQAEQMTNPRLRGYSAQFKQYEGLICNMQEFVLSNRGSFLNASAGTSLLHTPKDLEAIRFVRDVIIGKVAPRGVLTYEEPESLHPFIQGHAVFHRNWPYAFEILDDAEKSRVAGKVDITNLPRFRNGRHVATLGGWQFAISNFSQKKKLAWKFVEFMTSRRIQKLFALSTGVPPARKSVYRDPEVVREYPHFTRFADVFETAAPRPQLALYPLYSDMLQRFYHRILSIEGLPLETEAAQTDKQVEDLLGLMREAGL
jgi:multiple sugar transport system substrate-binding protein